jgi:hypothetical protein
LLAILAASHTRPQEVLGSTQETSSLSPERSSVISHTGPACRQTVPFSGTSKMTSNHRISTYNISKYSRQLTQPNTVPHLTSTGREWEHRSGSRLRLLLERIVMDNGSLSPLALRVTQDSSPAFKPSSEPDTLVGCFGTQKYVQNYKLLTGRD